MKIMEVNLLESAVLDVSIGQTYHIRAKIINCPNAGPSLGVAASLQTERFRWD